MLIIKKKMVALRFFPMFVPLAAQLWNHFFVLTLF